MCINSRSVPRQTSQVSFMNDFQRQVTLNNAEAQDFVTCPIGVLFLLTTLFGSGAVQRSTATQLAKTLHFKSEYTRDNLTEVRKEAKGLYQGLYDELATQRSYIGHDRNSVVNVITINNGVFVKRGYRVQPKFPWSIQNEFHSTYEELDFTNQSDSARRINNWVNSKTHGLIPQFFKYPQELPADSRLALFNAFTFKDNWLKTFMKYSTKPESFHSSANRVSQIPMMSSLEKLPIINLPDLGFTMLRKPLKNHRFSIIIVLPTKRWDLAGIDKFLNMEYSVKDLLARQQEKEVSLKLPRFKIESSTNLIPTMKAMGVEDLFDRNEADLGGITTEERLYIRVFKQNTVLKVDESGVEAAAVTGMVAVPVSMVYAEVDFHVNHPFGCLIYDEQMNIPLVAARIIHPRE